MLGKTQDFTSSELRLSEDRGLIPRILEYLFELVEQEKRRQGEEQISYMIKCSTFEIYNEKIRDLLDVASTSL